MAKNTASFKRSHSTSHHERASVTNKNSNNCSGSGVVGFGTVTRVCGNKFRQNYQQHHNPSGVINKNNSHHNSRHNVEIATQVISPSAIGSAIGGSLKISGRRFCKHLDAEADDDDEGLFSKKSRISRIPWGKLSCYGLSIGVVLLILTGVVLAVGYMQSKSGVMQSEKQRMIQIHSQKLSQARPWSYSDMMPTTWRPKIRMENVTVLPVIGIRDSATDDDEESFEENQNQRPPIVNNNEGPLMSGRSSEEEDEDEDDNEDIEELEIYKVPEEPERDKEEQPLSSQESQNSEQRLRLLTELIGNNNKERVEEDEMKNNENDQHKPPSEVKVLPPKDFNFRGFSFEFPIYNQSDSNHQHQIDDEKFEAVKNNSDFSKGSFNDPILSLAIPSLATKTTIDFPLVDLNFTFTPSSILSNFSLPTSTIDKSNNDRNNDNFNLRFMNHLKELEGAIEKNENSIENLNNKNSDRQSNENDYSSGGENSFNVPSFNNLKLQTELFEEELSDKSLNEDDLDSGDDSTMSASNKMRGRNPPSSRKPSDNMYTPRPGTISSYPDRPNRLYSAKSRPNHNSRNNNNDGVDLEGYTMNKSYGSDKNEVRVPAPSSTTTAKPAEIKFDFSSFTTNAPPVSSSSDNNNNPSTNSIGESNTKASDTTHEFNFNFNTFKPSSTDTTTTSAPPPLNFNEYQILPPSSSSPSPTSLLDSSNNNNFNFDFSQLTTPPPPTGATQTPAYQLTTNPDILTKRTFNFDFDTSASSNFNSNPFAHLLGGNQGVTGVIGTASSTGAGLGYGNNFNFDTSSFNNYGGGNHHIPSGTIPIDLASSYIQVGNPPPLKTNEYGQNIYQAGSNNFDYTNYAGSSPNYALSTPSSGGHQNGQQPNYNTITQGIHLLSLLSGNIPQHLLDTQTSASNNNHNQFNFQSPTKPQYEIAALAGYGGSNTGFLNNFQNNPSSGDQSLSDKAPPLNLNINLSPYVPAESRSLFTFGNDLHSSKAIPSNSGDQQTSFSQIVSKVADFSNIYKKVASSSTADSLTSESALPSALPPSSPVTEKVLDNLPSLNLEREKIFQLTKNPTETKKTDGPPPPPGTPDMEMAASEIRNIINPSNSSITDVKPVINFSKKLLGKTAPRKSSTAQEPMENSGRGLKSGFFT